MDKKKSLSSAEVCRQNGIVVGDTLEGDEGYGKERIVITAIGEEYILARRTMNRHGEAVRDREAVWTLSCRGWKKVAPKEPDHAD
jgi:hypothetical protein